MPLSSSIATNIHIFICLSPFVWQQNDCSAQCFHSHSKAIEKPELTRIYTNTNTYFWIWTQTVFLVIPLCSVRNRMCLYSRLYTLTPRTHSTHRRMNEETKKKWCSEYHFLYSLWCLWSNFSHSWTGKYYCVWTVVALPNTHTHVTRACKTHS